MASVSPSSHPGVASRTSDVAKRDLAATIFQIREAGGCEWRRKPRSPTSPFRRLVKLNNLAVMQREADERRRDSEEAV